MAWPWRTIRDLHGEAAEVRRRRFGVIDVREGRLAAVHFRPYPTVATVLDACVWGPHIHAERPGDRCRLYFNQPWGAPRYLSVRWAISHRETGLASIRGALAVLDEIARLKQVDALVCQAFNSRLSDRLFRRWGWERHCEHLPGRHYIRRFYGAHPPASAVAAYLPMAANPSLT